MGLWDKLRQASDKLRKLRLSLGRDSYYQYKRGREHERKQVDDARKHAKSSAQTEREEAERGRQYEERYTREREGDIAREPTDPAKETEPDR
jgi:hypothetical protein